MRYINGLSRLLIAAIFIVSGFGKIAHFSQMAQMMSGVGFPLPSFFLLGSIVLELGAGLLLLAGYKTRLVATALAVFLVPTTWIFHAAHLADPAQASQQMVEVLKNAAIIGGLLKFAVEGAGSLSIDTVSKKPVRGERDTLRTAA